MKSSRRTGHIEMRRNGLRILAYTIILIGAFSCLFPFFWMLSTAVKKLPEVFAFPPILWPDNPQWVNFPKVLSAIPFTRFFLNSLYIAIIVTIGQTIICSLSAYAFARLEFPARDRLFFLFLATMMIPGQVTMIPAFVLMRWLGWINTHKALIVPGLSSPFGIFLLRQFFLGIPHDLEDAATIDGCNKLQIYATIVLPLSKPALATLGVFTFHSTWDSFMWPLITINSHELRTLPIGLAFLQSAYLTNWPLLMAGAILSIIPMLVIFLISQRYFVEGIALTGIKG